jgi:hypothetical protein
MSTVFGSLRRILLAPSLADVTFAKRGFPGVPSAATERLEAIPQAVVCGFEWGIDSRGLWEVERRLALVDVEMRGFAYEGAAMAYTVRDAMSGGGRRCRDLLRGSGQPHIFLAYIGIGFAMSHLPRPLWKKVIPDLDGTPYHPTMTWFAVDGYGFDLAYFHTKRWVDQQRIPKPYDWMGHPDYFLRAVDQGIGRALWFIHGGRAADVSAALVRFAPARHADLWSGVGLAATFAGGCQAADLSALRAAAGDFAAEVSLGSVLAAKARHYSGFVPAHTEAALMALADLTIEEAVDLADRTEVPSDAPGPMPPYELWRRRIHAHFAVPVNQFVD